MTSPVDKMFRLYHAGDVTPVNATKYLMFTVTVAAKRHDNNVECHELRMSRTISNQFDNEFNGYLITKSIYWLETSYYRLIKIKLRSFKSSKYVNEKVDGPYRGFGYLKRYK